MTLPVAVSVALLFLLSQALPACEFPGLAAEADQALHATSADATTAALVASEGPEVAPGRLYAVQLKAADQVKWLVPPKRLADAAHPFGGVLVWRGAVPGRWRVALSNSAWVDLVVNGVALTSVGHGGDANCQRPHKVVDFDLTVEASAVIQISHSADEQLQMSIRRIEPAQ